MTDRLREIFFALLCLKRLFSIAMFTWDLLHMRTKKSSIGQNLGRIEFLFLEFSAGPSRFLNAYSHTVFEMVYGPKQFLWISGPIWREGMSLLPQRGLLSIFLEKVNGSTRLCGVFFCFVRLRVPWKSFFLVKSQICFFPRMSKSN